MTLQGLSVSVHKDKAEVEDRSSFQWLKHESFISWKRETGKKTQESSSSKIKTKCFKTCSNVYKAAEKKNLKELSVRNIYNSMVPIKKNKRIIYICMRASNYD